MKSALLLIATVATAQTALFHFEDGDRNVVVDAGSGRVSQAGTGYVLVLRGKVVATQKSEGLEIRANQVQADATAKGKQTELSRAIATGAVRMTKTSATKAILVIESKRADYRAAAGAEPKVELLGPVKIRNVNPAKHENLLATGAHGWATLERGTKGAGPTGIRRAELSGPVRIELDRANEEGPSKLIATANRAVIDEASKEPTITLTGNVTVNTEGSGPMFRVRNQRRVVLKLNAKGEMTALNAEPNP